MVGRFALCEGMAMRIHFALEDLARVQMRESSGPILESVFALQALNRPGDRVFHEWRRRTLAALDGRTAAVEGVLRRYRPVPDLLWLGNREFQRQQLSSSPVDEAERRAVSRVVFEFCRVAVMPYWSSLRVFLQADREERGREVMMRGMDGLLSRLHPRMIWDPPVLTIPGAEERDVHLDGRGLTLRMSLFLRDVPAALIEDAGGKGNHSLVVSVSSSAAISAVLQAASGREEERLGALIGHTRTAALQIMLESCTTGELSDRLGISLAGASKHAKILRKAGLVTTARNGNSGLHTLTTLGMALLQTRPEVFELPSPVAGSGTLTADRS